MVFLFEALNKNSREQYHSIYEQKQKLPYLRDAYSHVLQNVADRLDKSYKAFFKGNARYPRFKRHSCYNSFTYPDAYNGSVKLGSALRKTKLYLSMLGYVRVIVHRDVPTGEKDRDRTTREIFGPKTCTIKNESDKWFAILTYNTRKTPPVTIEKPERLVGIDLGLINAIATSDCHKIPPLRPLRQNEKRLKRLQRSLSRKKKGSKNREKARLLVSRLYWSIGMQRANSVHTVTRRIVDLHDFSCSVRPSNKEPVQESCSRPRSL
ncbi:MAG TPA: transposase [Candidatus Angelobacter sp.]|nr:transposase [Candidatus Angelobacter sp.]